MAQSLPSPIALRAFEAAARHLSFTRAARELNVTQAAISHQVKALESDLGTPLFRRMTRRLALTAEGATLYSVVGDAFERIAATAGSLRASDSSGPLTVSLGPYFAAAWLAPRIGRFWRRHPGIELHLHHTIVPVDFRSSAADLAVEWGDGDWPGLTSDLLLHVRATPVCSPSLLVGPHPLRRPEDLKHQILLHESGQLGWPMWLDAAGITLDNERSGPVIDDHNVLLHAAMDGHGVALAEVSFIDDDVATGRLARPFDLVVDMEAAYYILTPPGALDRPKVCAFRDWMLEEAGATA